MDCEENECVVQTPEGATDSLFNHYNQICKQGSTSALLEHISPVEYSI